ncbi:MAG: Ig-like domain-containing protein, partial [Actinomycetota bacterium]|nr:Ig-like domain-containing protein [Actinomycetota bacterium]
MLILLAGCSGSEPGGSRAAEETGADAAPPQVALAVADGAVDVSPVVPLEISVADGELVEATLAGADGTDVPGSLTESAENPGGVFTLETPLAYGTSYTLTATAESVDDEQAEAASTFTTVTPETLSTPSIGPLDGTVVGVGMPIRLYFDDPVADKAAVESSLLVTSSNPTDGVWSWLDEAEVHFRPSTYWPANTEVTLDANLY